MDLKTLNQAIEQISEEKGLKPEMVLQAIETAIAAAYKKEYCKKNEIVKAKFDIKTGKLNFWKVKIVVDPNQIKKDEEGDIEGKIRFNPDRHILLPEALEIKPDIKVGEELIFPLEEKRDFSRIAAQTARQVILQQLREAEKIAVKEEFKNKEGEIISGVVQRFERGNVYVDLGRTIGVMYHNECVPGEHYKPGDRYRFYVLAVQEPDSKRPAVVLSRSHPNFIKKLFEMEVPEIAEGVVEIKAIAREPGSRTKVALHSNSEEIDAIGSAVGQRGVRIMSIINELGNEKIDVVEYSDDPEKFIKNALAPAKVKIVEILPKREAKVFVSEDQLSLAIGKGGQNVRLAAKLTGWKIDVRSQSRPDEIQEGGVAEANEVLEEKNENLNNNLNNNEENKDENLKNNLEEQNQVD